MPLSPFEKEISRLKREIKQLKQAYDGAFAQHKADLLVTQKFIAELSINFNADNTARILKNNMPQKSNNITNQIAIDASKSITHITTSESPLIEAEEFHRNCNRIIKENNINLTWY